MNIAFPQVAPKVGRITLDIEGISKEDLLRYQEAIFTLVRNGVFSIKNGKAVLNFDAEGTLQLIQFEYAAYRRKKEATDGTAPGRA